MSEAIARRPIRARAAAKLRAIGCIAALIVLSACGGIETTHTAEETLALAAAGLSGMDRYGFSVRTEMLLGDKRTIELESYEGEVTGHKRLQVWPRGGLKRLDAVSDGDARIRNPAGWLARIEQLDKTVEYVPGGADGSKLTLFVALAEDAARQELSAVLRDSLEQVLSEAESGAAKAEDAAGLRRAIAKEAERSRAELERMLLTLEVDTGIVLDIERSRLLPVRMEERTTMRYEGTDGVRTEDRVTSVTFAGYDGRP